MTTDTNKNTLSSYSLLGRSGLRVSPLCLGGMTFGTEWGWGADTDESQKIFDAYVGAGGNYIDTANAYTNGRSEEMLGDFMTSAKNRDRLVLATKFTMTNFPGDPNASGNGRKNIYQSVEGSLRRLKTDYIDIYWMHMWDRITPVEEVMDTLDDLVRAGKIRYIGLSDVPAWYLARAQTLAELRGNSRVTALQLEYSLVERNIELDHIPAAQELGIGVCPWSPLAGGFLTGKYKRGANGTADGVGRLAISQLFNRGDDRNWNILDVLVAVANELGKTPAQVALNWVAKQPGINSTLIGASTLNQLQDNLEALNFDIPKELVTKLDQASQPGLPAPYNVTSPQFLANVIAADVSAGPNKAVQ